MADAVSHNSKPQSIVPSAHANPSKFFSHFLCKAALVTVFLVLLPLFPSVAPEFINQTLHARSWELLQLIFVGIAVSYGLFSKKNDEEEKDHSSKLDNAQSYVSKLLQVSSVFDDESETQTVIDENKVHTWSSQYYRGEPVVVVAKESPVVKEEKGVITSEISQKPLLLPVRSLKQPSAVDLGDESGGKIGSKRLTSSSRKPKNVQNLEENLEENVVLRSPIPWRSRMEIKENGDRGSPLRPSGPNSSSKNSSFSSESQPKSGENVARKKGFSSPPPAPPPPPPQPFLRKSNSSVTSNAATSEKVLRRSVRSVPAETEIEEPTRRVKSVRTFRSNELAMGTDIRTPQETMQTNVNLPEEEEKELVETSDEESEADIIEEDDYFEGNSGNGEAITENSVNDVGPDVDKKADEFIAKFREQIRLQRIESIRRSTAQRAGKSLS